MDSRTFTKRTIICAIFLLGNIATYGDGFVSKRLMLISQGIEQKHPRFNITRRMNDLGQMEHIGLRLFSDVLRKEHPSPTYDFLERYLLELNLANGTENEIVLLQKPVYFIKGNYRTALQIDSTYVFQIDEIEFHKYRTTWSKGGKVILQMVYDMDYQLLSGCSISELEEGFIQRLKRHIVENIDTLPERGTYMIAPNINNNLFIDHTKPPCDSSICRNYIFSSKQASRSIANLMLAEDLPVDVEIQLTFNRYDYKTDSLTVPICSLLNFCRSVEKCTPYFAIKHYKGSDYEGLLLFANRNSGYMHMLTVTINKEILENTTGVIKGKILVYIPLHNVKQEYLNLTEYETVQ